MSDIIPYGRNDYYLATIHRPSNTDSEDKFVQILNSFGRMDKPVVWPVHPRNTERLKRLTIPANLHLIEPQPYMAMLYLIENSSKVLTDSGGLQKEAYWLKKQCITLREETEWVETLEGNWNTLAGKDLGRLDEIIKTKLTSEWKAIYGNGKASKKIAEIIYNS